jgi:hypothetical protein
MTVLQPTTTYLDKRARAELLSGIGAAVLGAGLALVFRDFLAGMGTPLLVLGITIHAVGMYQKHRLDAPSGTLTARWTAWAYWSCWLLLAAFAGYLWLSRP